MHRPLKTVMAVIVLGASVAAIVCAVYEFFIASTTSVCFIGGRDGPNIYFISGHKN